MRDLADIVRMNDAAHAAYAEVKRRFDVARVDVQAAAWELSPQHSTDSGDVGYTVGELTVQWGAEQTLRVSGANSESTIFDSRLANSAMRAWHDLTHVLTGFGYTFDDEIHVAQAQRRAFRNWLEQTKRGTPSAQDDALAVLWFDTAGQNMHHMRHGGFPRNQRAFVWACFQLYAGVELRGNDMVRAGYAINRVLERGPY